MFWNKEKFLSDSSSFCRREINQFNVRLDDLFEQSATAALIDRFDKRKIHRDFSFSRRSIFLWIFSSMESEKRQVTIIDELWDNEQAKIVGTKRRKTIFGRRQIFLFIFPRKETFTTSKNEVYSEKTSSSTNDWENSKFRLRFPRKNLEKKLSLWKWRKYLFFPCRKTIWTISRANRRPTINRC